MDRIPALAGIAAEFEKHLEDNSMYGLWASDMHRGILFQQPYDFLYSPQDARYLPAWHDTPSWSWAALNKPVVWNAWGLLGHRLTHLTNIDMIPCLGSSRLRLRETFIICLSAYGSFPSPGDENSLATLFVGLNKSGFEFDFYLDHWFAMTFREHPSRIASTTARDERLTTPTRDDQSLLQRTVIVPITCCVWYWAKHNDNVANVWCLLLCAPPGAEEGVYRRAGVVAATKYFGGHEEVDADMIKAQFNAYRRPVARHFFQEEDDQGNYTVMVM